MRTENGSGSGGDGRQESPRREVGGRHRLGVVRTGGTVGSSTRAMVGSDELVVELSRGEDDRQLFAEVLAERADGRQWDLQYAQPGWRRLSENMAPPDWSDIADQVLHLAHQGNDMVLVLHGTDTATYTAAALSFLLADLPVPVVVTGANLPPSEDGTDAFHNVDHALTAATRLGPGTYLSFSGSPRGPSAVHLGTCARKVLASSQAFFSINRPPVGRVVDTGGEPVFEPSDGFRRQGWVDHHLASTIPAATGGGELDARVLSFAVYPGCDLEALLDVVGTRGYRGVVLQLYPSGTGPEHDGPHGPVALPAFVEACTARDVVVVGTVAVGPSLATNHYESTLALVEAGAVLSRYLLPETALVKLMWLLARSSDTAWTRETMTRSIAGEIPDDEAIGEFHRRFA